MQPQRIIDSPEMMIRTIRRYGILPFFRGAVPGWSVEEMTAPGCWFTDEGVLGPWDWKIEVVREGDIAYGKFLGGKAAFATVEWYRLLMSWRRSLPKYRVALGEPPAKTPSGQHELQIRTLAPIALNAIRQAGAMEARELRLICSEATKTTVKKNVMDSVMQFLQMGTWSVIGDIRRVYRGPNLTYSGWQLASNTTPDALFQTDHAEAGAPFWAHHLDEAPAAPAPAVPADPATARQALLDHILTCRPDASPATLLKLL